MTKQLLAGAGGARITPPTGHPMGGYGARDHGAEGVHDHLNSHTLFLDDGTTRAVIIASDLIGMRFEHVARVRELVNRATGVPAGQRLPRLLPHPRRPPDVHRLQGAGGGGGDLHRRPLPLHGRHRPAGGHGGGARPLGHGPAPAAGRRQPPGAAGGRHHPHRRQPRGAGGALGRRGLVRAPRRHAPGRALAARRPRDLPGERQLPVHRRLDGRGHAQDRGRAQGRDGPLPQRLRRQHQPPPAGLLRAGRDARPAGRRRRAGDRGGGGGDAAGRTAAVRQPRLRAAPGADAAAAGVRARAGGVGARLPPAAGGVPPRLAGLPPLLRRQGAAGGPPERRRGVGPAPGDPGPGPGRRGPRRPAGGDLRRDGDGHRRGLALST